MNEDFNQSQIVDSIASTQAQFTVMPGWLEEFAKTNPAAFTFYYCFRLHYGGMASVYKDQEAMAAELGYPYSTFKKHLKALVEVGAISRGRRHRKWSGSILFFNAYPHQNDEVARTYHLARQYPEAKPVAGPAPQFTETPKPKQTVDISACTSAENAYQMLAKHYAKLFPEQEGLAKALLLNYLSPEGNIKQAVNGLYEMKAKGWKISHSAFDSSLKERGDFIPQDHEQAVNKQRDKVNELRRVEALKAHEAKHKAQAKPDFDYRQFRAQKQAELEKEEATPLTQEEVQARFDDMLVGVEF